MYTLSNLVYHGKELIHLILWVSVNWLSTLPLLWKLILLHICPKCWENSRPTIIIMSRVKVWKCPPRDTREVAVALWLSGWLLLGCPQNIAKYRRTKSWGLSVRKSLERSDPTWSHGIGIWRGFILTQRKDHRASGVKGKRGMDSLQRRNAHARN